MKVRTYDSSRIIFLFAIPTFFCFFALDDATGDRTGAGPHPQYLPSLLFFASGFSTPTLVNSEVEAPMLELLTMNQINIYSV